MSKYYTTIFIILLSEMQTWRLEHPLTLEHVVSWEKQDNRRSMATLPSICHSFIVITKHTYAGNCLELQVIRIGTNRLHPVSMVTSITCRCKDFTRSLVLLHSFDELKSSIRQGLLAHWFLVLFRVSGDQMHSRNFKIQFDYL